MGLVIVDGLRERHEHRRQPRCAQFGDRRCARAAHREIGPGVGGCHVLDERHDLNVSSRGLVQATGLVVVLRTRLMAHQQLDPGRQALQNLREDDIDPVCALAAAEHEQAQVAMVPRIALTRRRERRNRFAHGIAEPLAAGKCIGESTKLPFGKMRQDAIGRTGNSVLLVHEEWHAAQPCGDAARTRGKSAKGDGTARANAAEQPPRGP